MLQSTRILVVDDNPSLLTCVSDYLRDQGFYVSSASSSEEACDLLDSQEYDLLLSDINMPVLGGLALVKMLREAGSPIVSVAMSGADYSEESKASGFNRFLPKPFTPEELTQALTDAQALN